MAFKVVHSENYDLKQEMNESLHIIKRKCYTWKPRMWGKSQSIWSIRFFFIIMYKNAEIKYIKWFPTIKVTKKVEGTNKHKYFLLEKNLPLLEKS